ncbi:MAG TPA: T9SS type A sorting domain-containing protein, partial [Bacteroidia bacterium]
TLDQAAAMQQTLSSHVSYRDDLWKYGNHVATGIDSGSFLGTYADSNYFFPNIIPGLPVCAPVADFSANRKYICQGGTVTFTDHSWRAATTSLSWSFPNGNPSTSASANPTVTFNTWGWQNISLTAINGNGADTKTVNNMIFVAPPWADYFGAFSEGFENNDFNTMWIVENEENSYPQWHQTNTAAYSGNNSVMLNAFSEDRDLYDAFITPSYDLSTCSNATLSFKYSCASAAQWNTDIKETLLVYVSTNCGQTWVQRKLLTGTALCNAGYYPSAFTPNSQNQWASCSVQLQNGDLGPKTRFRFQFYSGRFPNNIYIDDINLQATVGVNEVENYYFNLNVFPNPAGAENTISISYSLSSQENVKISLIDMVGREINVMNETQTPGEKTVNIDRHALDLKAGVYLVKISNGSSYDTRKLVITN